MWVSSLGQATAHSPGESPIIAMMERCNESPTRENVSVIVVSVLENVTVAEMVPWKALVVLIPQVPGDAVHDEPVPLA